MLIFPEFESAYSKAHVLRYLTSKQNFSSPAASTTRGMIYTLLINLVMVTIIMTVFESNRKLKQIFQKRYQRRFVESGRIPPEPSSRAFGWLVAIMKVDEIEVLHMVGLDAYMLLRYHVLCLKLCLFITFWGLLVLVPTYGTAQSKLLHWDKYTLINVIESNDKQRVWVAVLFGYVFSAYLCQLLYEEYQNFSNQRLNSLQANHDGQVNDTTDNLPQKYYTIMLEKIPPDLRSSEKLYEYFTELFPDDVYHIEVALDLRELNNLINKRNNVRNNLEKSIASYIAKQKRPVTIIKEGKFKICPNGLLNGFLHLPCLSACANSDITCTKCVRNLLSYERYGYKKVDAINFYTKSLIDLNREVVEKQKQFSVISKSVNTKEMQRKIKKKYDTRAAAAVEKISSVGSSMLQKVNELGIEVLIFGNKKSSKTSSHTSDNTDSNISIPNPIHHHVSDVEVSANGDGTADTAIDDNSSDQIAKSTSRNLDSITEEEVEVESSNSSSKSSSNNFNQIALVSKIKSKTKAFRKKIQFNSKTKNVVDKAKLVGQAGLDQTKLAGTGALRGLLEAERTLEMLLVGAYYKYSSTAFVTFRSRMAESIAYQMLLSDDNIEISHAPNPHDILWENVAIPKTQVVMRTYITNIGLVIGSIFWSSLVTSVNRFAKNLFSFELQQNLLSVFIILGFLLSLPAIFDIISTHYEGIKLYSEIQDSIMTRYFYYQMVNIYVSVGLGDMSIIKHILLMLRTPQIFINLLGLTIPSLSLYFCDLLIVKSFIAIPGEMCRPFQLSTIFLLGKLINRKSFTRRELRTGAFYAWPMLYGWVYPGLFLVLLIILIFSCIAPFMMPFGILFFVMSYLMYKYQLLYVYVNDNQALGFMFYAVFNRTLIIAIFASLTMLSFFGCHQRVISVGPFVITVPLPFALLYFWHYCDATFKKTSLDLSYSLSKKIDYRNMARKEANLAIPLDSFKKDLYRQPTLTEPPQYPEPYRKLGDSASDLLSANQTRNINGKTYEYGFDEFDIENPVHQDNSTRNDVETEYRLRSSSINVHYVDDEIEESTENLKKYFVDVVLNHLCTDKTCLDIFYNNKNIDNFTQYMENSNSEVLFVIIQIMRKYKKLELFA